MNNDFFHKLKPTKILGKGSQGTVILANNNKYSVKIYTKKSKNLIMLIKIINYFISYKNIPTTIYKSYYLTEKKNSLKPEYFSYNINKYNSKYLLFEVMKTYKITLKDFVDTINNNNNRINILISLFYQGLYTFLWLYMKKGIVHLDINSDNFFVEKTMSEEFIVEIKNIEFKIPTSGYNLVISDFGFAKSIEFMDYDNYKYRYDIRVNLESFDIHPHQDIINFIKLFKKYFSKYNINLTDLDINIDNVNIHMINRTQQDYRDMLRSYYKKKDDLKSNIKKFKDSYFNYFRKYILNDDSVNLYL
jgi:hypothetical protein